MENAYLTQRLVNDHRSGLESAACRHRLLRAGLSTDRSSRRWFLGRRSLAITAPTTDCLPNEAA